LFRARNAAEKVSHFPVPTFAQPRNVASSLTASRGASMSPRSVQPAWSSQRSVAKILPSTVPRTFTDLVLISPRMRACSPSVSVPVESIVPSTSPSMSSEFTNLTEPLIETPRERRAPDGVGMNVRLDGPGTTDGSGRFVCGGSVRLREAKRVKDCMTRIVPDHSGFWKRNNQIDAAMIVWNTQNRRTVATANELQIAAWAGAVAISLPVIRLSVNCGSQTASNLDHDRRNVVTLDVLLCTPMKSCHLMRLVNLVSWRTELGPGLGRLTTFVPAPKERTCDRWRNQAESNTWSLFSARYTKCGLGERLTSRHGAGPARSCNAHRFAQRSDDYQGDVQ
jgi:hypothetical protein